MISKINRLYCIISEAGIIAGVVATMKYILPSPMKEWVSFLDRYQKCSKQYGKYLLRELKNCYQGYLPKSRALYNLESISSVYYLSDFEEEFGWDINEPYAEWLNDTLSFYEIINSVGYGQYIPKVFGVVDKGAQTVNGLSYSSLLEREGKVIIKGARGGGGENVYICAVKDGEPLLTDKDNNDYPLDDKLPELEGYMVSEFCTQANYAASIYPPTPNTIRLLTMRPRNRKPFIAATVHRFGSGSSGVVDNFSQGGLSAAINEGGEIGAAVRYHCGEVTWHTRHPDTGSQIAGIEIPHWDQVRNIILSIVQRVPEFTYVGWDVIVTETGPKIIEGNSNSDTDLLQAHAPLLRSHKILEFYLEHDIVSHWRLKSLSGKKS